MSELPPQYGKYQLESGGYMRLVNQILEDLARAKLTSRQLRIVLCVIRKTYGHNKRCDRISLSQIAQATGIFKEHVSREISKLISYNVLFKEGGQRGKIGYQKYAQRWLLPTRIEADFDENLMADVPKIAMRRGAKWSN